MFRTTIIILCLLLLPFSVFAIEITPMGGYTFGGDLSSTAGKTIKLDEGGSFALAINQNIDSSKQLELFWHHQKTDLTASDGTNVFTTGIDYIHIGGTVLYPQGGFIPYAAGGLGVTHFSPDNDYNSETRFSISVGGGIKTFITEHIGLRLEGRGYATLFPESGYAFCGGNGCTVAVSGDGFFQFEGLAGAIILF